MLHYIQEVSGGIGSNFMCKACVKGCGASVTALQLNERLLEKEQSLTVLKKYLWEATNSDGFKSVEPESRVGGWNFSFRHVIPVPPFVVKTIIEHRQSVLEHEGLIEMSSGKQWLEENEDFPSIIAIKEALGEIFSFIWEASRGLILDNP